MRYAKGFGYVGVFLLAGSLTLRADVWDAGAVNDNVAANTRNHLIHGAEQVHDLAAQGGVADQDWYMLTDDPYSSYIVTVDGLTADLNMLGGVSRRSVADPNTSLGDGFLIQGGRSVAMAWENGVTPLASFLRIADGNGCGATCGANSQYRVRLYDTTFTVPRFNNANSQVTVLLAQNTGGGTPNWTAIYRNGAGNILKVVPSQFTPYQLAVVNLATIPELQNQAGAITVTSTTGLGGMAVKSVALEPATGFSFDTLGTYRAR